MNDSLYRNSIYLLLNLGIGSFASFIFWIIITHLYTTTNVGRAIALITAVTLIGSLSSLGLARTIIRFLTNSKNKSQDIVTKIVLSMVSAIIFSLIIAYFLPRFNINHAGINITILLTVAGIITVLKSLFDHIFISFRASKHTLIENTASNLSKIILIFFVLSLGYIGILISQVGAALIGVLISIFLLKFYHGINFKIKPSLKTMSGFWSFSIGSYFNDMLGYLPSTIIPILVILKIGAANTALWYISMQIATIIFLVSGSINQSFLAESSHKEKDLLNYAIRATKLMFIVLIPIVLFVLVLAPEILSIFGKEYQHAAQVLRILALSSLLVILSYITGTILNIFKKIWYLAVTNSINAGIVIVGCLLFGNTLNKFGVIYLVGEIFNVLLFGLGAIYVLKKETMLFTCKTDKASNLYG